MDDKNDLQERLNAISIPELRSRINRVMSHLREMRRSFAVHAGMTLERMPGPIPSINDLDMQEAYDLVIELLPILRAPLTPEEREQLQARIPEETAALDEALEAMVEMDPEEFNELMEDTGFTHEQVILLKEGAEKMEMLDEVARELRAVQEELIAYRDKLVERAAATLEAFSPQKEPERSGN